MTSQYLDQRARTEGEALARFLEHAARRVRVLERENEALRRRINQKERASDER